MCLCLPASLCLSQPREQEICVRDLCWEVFVPGHSLQASAGFSFLLRKALCFQYCGGMSKLLYPVPFN